MKKVLSMFLVLLTSTMMWGAKSSVPDNAPDVMLQAFYWDSYPNGSGSAYGNTGWSTLLNQVDELGEYFDLVWLPPVAGGAGTGYHPKQYSNLSSAWGNESQLRELITKLKAKGTRTVADIVINHIEGSTSWCSFATMDFGTYGKFYPEASWICKTDEMNKNDNAGSCKGLATGADDDGYGDEANYSEARDWDHKSSNVQAMFRAYLKWLKNDVGFDGWRYDYGKGFHHSHINDYNSAAEAYMSVVEYWDGNSGVIRSRLEDASWNNMAFDFGTKYDALNNGICSFDYSKCKGAGLLGAGLSKHAVTFVDNHDTFTRNDSEFGGQNNSMSSNLKDRLLQANAYILSMPGIPCVFYPHWVTYKDAIKPMIEARHLVGVHSQSEVKDESAEQGGYQATIVGSNGWLILQLGNKVGGSFDGFTKKASGTGYAIWVKTNTVDAFYLTGNAALVGDKAWKADAIKVTGNTYTFENLAAGKDYALKVTVDGTWDTAKGFSDLTTTADGLSGDNDGNICFSLSEAGNVTVTYTGAVFKLEGKFATSGSGSGEQPQPGEKDSIFLVNAKTWANPTVHLWGGTANGTEWPGVAMTKVDEKINGFDVYKYVADKGAYKNCIFNNAGKDQSADLDWTSGKYYYIDKWYAKEDIPAASDPGQGDTPTPGEKDSIFLVNAKAWANPTVHLWGGTANGTEWPGVAMTKVDEKINGFDVYKYVADKGAYKNCIFNNAGKDQSADLDWTSGKYYYIDKWYAKEDIPAATDPGQGDDPQPGAAKFYITGDSALVVDAGLDKSKAWSPSAIKSEKDTFELSLKANQAYALKVTLDGSWNTAKSFDNLTEKADGLSADGDGNICFKLAEAGKIQVIYSETVFKLAGKFVTEGSGSGDDPQPGATKFYITGDSALIVDAGLDKSKAWSPSAIKSEKDTFELNLKANQAYALKVTLDGSWNTAKSFDNLTEKADGLSADGDGNICFKLAEAGKVQVIYSETVFKLAGKFVTEGSGSGDDPQPGAAKFYVTGDTALVVAAGADKMKAWKADAIKSEKDTLVLDLPKGLYHLKVVVDGNWEGGKVKGFTALTEPATAGLSADTDDNIVFTLDEAGKVQVIYTDKLFKVDGKFHVETPAKFYITGDSALVVDAGLEKAQAWNPAAIKSEKDTFELSLKANQYYLIKLTLNGTWDGENNVKGYNELTEKTEGLVDDGNDHNIGFKLSEAGKIQVIYTVKDGKTVYKLVGKFVTEGGSGEQPGAAKFYVTGDSALIVDAGMDKSKAWSPSAIKSEKDTFELSLKANQAYALKVTLDGSWNTAKSFDNLTEKADGLSADGDGNICFKLAEAGKVQVIYSETVFKLAGKFVTEGSGSGDDPQPGAAKFYITGDSALIVDAGLDKEKAWSPSAIKSEKDTFELDLKANQYYLIKLTLNGTWDGENNVKGYNELTEKTEGLVDDGDDHNIGFKLSEAGKVLVIYTVKDGKTIYKLVGKFVTEGGSGEQPGAAKFYITGDSALIVDAGLDKEKAWSPSAIKSEKDTFELDLKANQYYQIKVTLNGTWDGENNVKGYNELTEKTEGLVDDGDDHNIGFKLSEAGKVQVIYTVKDGKTIYKLVGKFVTEGSGSGEQPTVADGYYLLGTANGWKAAAAYQFTANSQNDKEYYLSTTLTAGDEFKVAKVEGGEPKSWYPDQGGNYTVDEAHAGAKTIYFQTTYNADWAEFGGYFYIGESIGTDVDAVESTTKATKVIRDGQLVIIRGTRTYTVMGQLVR